MTESINEPETEEVETMIIDYLKKYQTGRPDDIYSKCRSSIPYYLLKQIIFAMFKKKILRRRLIKGIGAEYAIASLMPRFGSLYVPSKPRKSRVIKKKTRNLSTIESCRVMSKMYEFDQLLRNVRE